VGFTVLKLHSDAVLEQYQRGIVCASRRAAEKLGGRGARPSE